MQYDAAKVAAKTEVSGNSERLAQLKKRIGEESLGPQDQRDKLKRQEKQYGRLLQLLR